jgi:RNA polymerase sigma-70 factor (ECF subfamily)
LRENEELIQVINGCIQAKRESQKIFYKKFYGFSMAICMRYCATKDDASEVVNDGFIKIFRNLSLFIPRHHQLEASLMGWMKSIIIHTAIDHFRKQNRKHFSSDFTEIETSESESDNSESSIDRMSYKEILAVVERLTPMYRTVFNLYVIDGYKHEDIAKTLNISIGTSKSNLSKARLNIQKMLKEAQHNYYEKKAV